jgi:hypothetical protein
VLSVPEGRGEENTIILWSFTIVYVLIIAIEITNYLEKVLKNERMSRPRDMLS